MQKLILLFATAFSISAFAVEQPAGKTTLKMESAKSRQEIRKEIGAIDTKIEDLSEQITSAKSQALTNRGIPTMSTMAATYEAQANALDLQRKELMRERKELQAKLSPEPTTDTSQQ